MDTSMTWARIRGRRLERHGLCSSRAFTDPADAVAAVCGAHAQVLSAAELSVGLRLDGATRVDVRRALWTDRTLVKTFGPRGTVHLLPTRDLPLWTGALAAVPSRPAALPAGAMISDGQVDEVVAAIGVALSDAELTVDELGEEVVRRTGAWAGELVLPAFQTMWPRWRLAVTAAANRGVLCFGENKGRKVTYTNPHRWLPDFAPAHDTGLGELVKRYLHAYGPATPQQFARWLSAPIGWAKAVFAGLEPELRAVEFEGDTAWLVAGDEFGVCEAESGLRLLPYFDAYAVGSYPRERVFPGAAWTRALGGGQAGNYPVLLLDGVVSGVWHLRRSGRKLAITVEPLRNLTARRLRELDDQVSRVGEILEGRPELTIGPVSVGPHA